MSTAAAHNTAAGVRPSSAFGQPAAQSVPLPLFRQSPDDSEMELHCSLASSHAGPVRQTVIDISPNAVIMAVTNLDSPSGAHPVQSTGRSRAVRLSATAEDHRLAQLATAAIGLSLIDAAIPLPVPGVKPGLANIVTLLVLARHGWSAAAWVTGLRVFAGSILLGHFLSPAFFMSLSGALCALLFLRLAICLPGRWFGPVSWSILAALAHLGGQLALARLWLIPHDGLFLLLPLFAVAALLFGTINGLIAARLLQELSSPEPAAVEEAHG